MLDIQVRESRQWTLDTKLVREEFVVHGSEALSEMRLICSALVDASTQGLVLLTGWSLHRVPVPNEWSGLLTVVLWLIMNNFVLSRFHRKDTISNTLWRCTELSLYTLCTDLTLYTDLYKIVQTCTQICTKYCTDLTLYTDLYTSVLYSFVYRARSVQNLIFVQI